MRESADGYRREWNRFVIRSLSILIDREEEVRDGLGLTLDIADRPKFRHLFRDSRQIASLDDI